VFWVKERVINFMKILGKRRINMTMLRSLAFRGVPSDVPGLRPIVWRVILGYLPRETSKWDAYLKQ
jgi:TBC1 domain family member 13